MSYRNHFSYFATAALLITGCTNQKIEVVQSDEYSSKQCWFDSDGNLRAFVALSRDGPLGVPYLISRNCMVKGDYSSFGEAIILHLGTVDISDPDGALRRFFPHVVIPGDRSELPLPSGESKMYFLRARVAAIPDAPGLTYAVRDVLDLIELEVSFERFLDLSVKDREAFLSRYK